MSAAEALTDSMNQLDADLTGLARQLAHEREVDEHLVLAVMIVENLQRPRWFRAVERLKGRVFPRGTYGIMQVEADRPIGDKDSIERAIKRFEGIRVAHPEKGYPERERFLEFASSYNGSGAYADLLMEAYVLAGGGFQVQDFEADAVHRPVGASERDELYLNLGKAVVPFILEMFERDDDDLVEDDAVIRSDEATS